MTLWLGGVVLVGWIVAALVAEHYAYGAFKGAPWQFFFTWPLSVGLVRQARMDGDLRRLEEMWGPPAPAPEDDRLIWEWDAEAYAQSFDVWMADSRKGTVTEILMACYHVDVAIQFDDSHKATMGTIVRARCNECHASTVALMDDWLDSRYKLSAFVRKCCSGIDTKLCGCGPCQRAREPRRERDHYYGESDLS